MICRSRRGADMRATTNRTDKRLRYVSASVVSLMREGYAMILLIFHEFVLCVGLGIVFAIARYY